MARINTEVEVDIDINDYLGEANTDDMVNELTSRKYKFSGISPSSHKDVVFIDKH